MINYTTCQKCGYIYEQPSHCTVFVNCPRCFPVTTQTRNTSSQDHFKPEPPLVIGKIELAPNQKEFNDTVEKYTKTLGENIAKEKEDVAEAMLKWFIEHIDNKIDSLSMGPEYGGEHELELMIDALREIKEDVENKIKEVKSGIFNNAIKKEECEVCGGTKTISFCGVEFYCPECDCGAISDMDSD